MTCRVFVRPSGFVSELECVPHNAGRNTSTQTITLKRAAPVYYVGRRILRRRRRTTTPTHNCSKQVWIRELH